MGKKRAPVWEHYELSRDGQGKQIAHCKRCRSQLVAEGTDGTTHVKRHLNICTGRQDYSAPPDVPAASPPGASPESSNFIQAANCEKATAALARQDGVPPPIASPPPIPAAPPLGASPESSNCSKAANLEEATDDLARMIALHGYDPSFVEDSYFRSFVRKLNPYFQLPSRAAIEDMCYGVCDEAREVLESELEETTGKVNVAIETVETEAGKVLYAACHFIDEDWNRRMSILDIHMVITEDMSPIPKISLVPRLYESDVDEYDVVQQSFTVLSLFIRQRVFSVVGGNSSHLDDNLKDDTRYWTAYNCNDALQMVGSWFYDNICSHFVCQLCRFSVTPLSFMAARQECGEFYSQFGLDHLLPYEEPWISLYFWLEFLLKTEKREASSSKIRKSRELMRNVFAAIYRASKTISDPNRPTSNIVLRELFKVRETLQSSLADASGDEAGLYVDTIFKKDVVDVLRKAEEILDGGIKKDYLRCSIPLLLDPRYKLKHMQILFIRAFSSEAREYMANIRKEIKEVLTSFSIDDGETSDADQIHETEITSAHQLELDMYLEDPLVKDTDDFDILNWWKLNSSKYPTLARMARAALAMRTSSKLSSEQMSQITSIIRGY